MKGPMAVLLAMEAIVILLGALAAATTTDISRGAVWAGGAALAVLCVAAAGMLRRGTTGVMLGSIAQVLAIVSGILIPAMFFLGAIFGGLWIMALVLDRRVEAARAGR